MAKLLLVREVKTETSLAPGYVYDSAEGFASPGATTRFPTETAHTHRQDLFGLFSIDQAMSN